MWQNLQFIHETHRYSAITAAKCTFYGVRAADGANVPEHIADMRRQYNKLHQMGCKISDKEYISVLTLSLPHKMDRLLFPSKALLANKTRKESKASCCRN